MSERRRAVLLAGTTVALVAVGLFTEWLYLRGRPQVTGLVDLATGWAIGACGVLAWATVPRSRLGPLLVLTSVAWFVGTPRDPGTDLGRLAIMALYLYAGPLTHALVTWPTGRITRPLDWVLVTGGYVVAVYAALWQRDVGVLVIGGLLAVALAVQHLTLSSRDRVTRGPVLVAGAVLVAGLLGKHAAAQVARDLDLGLLGDPDTLWSIALVTAASLLVGGAISLERRRAQMTDLVIELDDGGTGLAAIAADASDPVVRAAVVRAEVMLARNARLRAELDEQVHALAASRRRLLEAEDSERQLLERRLRTGPARQLEQLAASIDALVVGWTDDQGRARAAPSVVRAARTGECGARQHLPRARPGPAGRRTGPGAPRARGAESGPGDRRPRRRYLPDRQRGGHPVLRRVGSTRQCHPTRPCDAGHAPIGDDRARGGP